MKILFFAVEKSSFILKDIDILKSNNTVTVYDNGFNNIPRLFNEIKKNDLIFCWFASLNFFLPVLIAKALRKKIIIVAGGYDAANVPELKYGSFYSRWKSFFVNITLNSADKVLAVSESNKNEILKNTKTKPSKIEMIYHGFEKEGDLNIDQKKDELVSVGLINKVSFYRKGIDRIIRLAYQMPGYKFHLVGGYDNFIKSIELPPNIILHGYLNKAEFIEIMRSSKIYLQLSRHEAFGCSVAEAMLYGCFPVVSDSYSLPEVAGNSGLIIKEPDNLPMVKEMISGEMKDYNIHTATDCVERINKNFNIGIRKKKIEEVIEKLL